MPINLEEIFKETEVGNLISAADKISNCGVVKEKCLILLEETMKLDVTFAMTVMVCDKSLVRYTKAVAALMFEVGRLYGRQEIVNETLEEIK